MSSLYRHFIVEINRVSIDFTCIEQYKTGWLDKMFESIFDKDSDLMTEM